MTTTPLKFKHCKTPLTQGLGFMFQKNPGAMALVFHFPLECRPLFHMFFVFFKIDMIWLDKNKNVVDIKKNIKPFTPFIFSTKKAKFIIEIPSSQNAEIKIGENFNFSK